MEKTTEINVAYPAAEELHLRISVGACRFRIVPGAEDAWVRGTYHDPDDKLPIKVIEEGGTVQIKQEQAEGIFDRIFHGETPTLELGLGTTRPYMLTLGGGASENTLDLGGLPLTNLEMNQGAGKFSVDFSSPNPVAMEELTLDGGAAAFEMRNLAHANVAEMSVSGGAASYQFDFGGVLQRNADAEFNVGAASLEIRVPATTAAQIETRSVLGSVDVGDGFTKREGAFWTPAAVSDATPLLIIEANVSVGSIRLRTT